MKSPIDLRFLRQHPLNCWNITKYQFKKTPSEAEAAGSRGRVAQDRSSKTLQRPGIGLSPDGRQSGQNSNRPAFPLKLPRWFCTLRQRAYNRKEFVFKMEIPDRRLRDQFQGHLSIAEVQRGFVFVK